MNGCAHAHYSDGHCAQMSCPNYASRCRRHAPSGSPDATCTLDVHRDDGQCHDECWQRAVAELDRAATPAHVMAQFLDGLDRRHSVSLPEAIRKAVDETLR